MEVNLRIRTELIFQENSQKYRHLRDFANDRSCYVTISAEAELLGLASTVVLAVTIYTGVNDCITNKRLAIVPCLSPYAKSPKRDQVDTKLSPSIRAPVLDHDRISHGPRSDRAGRCVTRAQGNTTCILHACMVTSSRRPSTRERSLVVSTLANGNCEYSTRIKNKSGDRRKQQGCSIPRALESQSPDPIRVHRPAEDRSRTHARTNVQIHAHAHASGRILSLLSSLP